MFTFLDEAGDFTVPPVAGDHRVAVAAAVTVTDKGWEMLEDRFRTFCQELDPSELKDGEPKWHLLTSEHRHALTSLLDRGGGVSLTPVTLDLGQLVGRGGEWRDPMLDRLKQQPDLMLYDTAKEQMQLLYRQAKNLSAVQHLRLYAWAYCLHQALYHAIAFLGHGADARSWERVRIEIDAVQRAKRSREQQVFQIMLLAWLAGWARSRPFLTIQGIHTSDHPFVQLYDTGDGIDLGKLVRSNLAWSTSHDSAGLQVADLVAGAVYAAAMAPRDRVAVKEYGALMRNGSYYGPVRGPGLFSPFSEDEGTIASKYEPLSAAMERAAV